MTPGTRVVWTWEEVVYPAAMVAVLVSIWAEGITIVIGGIVPSSLVLSAVSGISVIALPWAVVGAGRGCGVLRIRSKRKSLGSKYRDWLVQGWLPTFAAAWGSALLASAALLPCLLLHLPVSTVIIVTKLAASAGWVLCRLEIQFLISRMRPR